MVLTRSCGACSVSKLKLSTATPKSVANAGRPTTRSRRKLADGNLAGVQPRSAIKRAYSRHGVAATTATATRCRQNPIDRAEARQLEEAIRASLSSPPPASDAASASGTLRMNESPVAFHGFDVEPLGLQTDAFRSSPVSLKQLSDSLSGEKKDVAKERIDDFLPCSNDDDDVDMDDGETERAVRLVPVVSLFASQTTTDLKLLEITNKKLERNVKDELLDSFVSEGSSSSPPGSRVNSLNDEDEEKAAASLAFSSQELEEEASQRQQVDHNYATVAFERQQFTPDLDDEERGSCSLDHDGEWSLVDSDEGSSLDGDDAAAAAADSTTIPCILSPRETKLTITYAPRHWLRFPTAVYACALCDKTLKGWDVTIIDHMQRVHLMRELDVSDEEKDYYLENPEKFIVRPPAVAPPPRPTS